MKENKKEKIKIALLMPGLSSGGMERVMTELANFFSSKDFVHISLILYGKNPKIFYTLNKKVIIYKYEKEFNDKIRSIETVKRVFYLRSVIKKIKPHKILSFGTHWNNFAILSLYDYRKSIFVSDRGSPLRKYGFFQEFLKNILYPKVSGIIAQTEMAKSILSERFPNANIRVIGNPIRFIESNEEQRNDSKMILSVGRLIKTKHHDRLINIFSQLDLPDWKLFIVGGEALKEHNLVTLQKQIDTLKMNDRIILVGESNQVESYYKKANIFAFTSSVEGFPNVIGEAVSAGLPVVAYDCVAGPSEMINDGENGFLIPLFKDSLFKDRLLSLVNDEELRFRMGIKSKLIAKKFEVNKLGEKFLNFLLEK